MKKYIKFLIFIIFIVLFIYFGTIGNDGNSNKASNKDSNVSKYFGSAYVFEEINHSKLLTKLNKKNPDMIIYACYTDSELCDSYAQLINEVALNYEIDEILYYDFKIDKKEHNATYQKILSKFSDYLMTDDFGNQEFYAPTLITIKDGFVYGFDDDLALKRGRDSYKRSLSQEELDLKREYLTNLFEEYTSNE